MENLENTSEKKSQRIRSRKFRLFSIAFICLIITFSSYKCPQARNFGKYIYNIIRPDSSNTTRTVANNNWAEKLDLPGLPNLHKVSDDLYRGAQPTKEGMKELEKLGIKKIVNLRSIHSDRDEMKDVNIPYEHIRMTTLDPDTDDIVRFLKIVSDSNNTPVFVHCRHGADRTGTMCAIYRIVVQGWSKEEAIQEMTKGGFGFHSIWNNLVKYIRKINIEQIKQKAELIEKTDTTELLSTPDKKI